uniref:Low affinity cationic amino acid transporter n=1 Tax=Mesocestoides corti TaxID=53468 RepID=A0A5K3FB48_MESCO
MRYLLHLIVVSSHLYLGLCMECYVCHNQEGNRDKCVKTSMQCLQDEDTCMTNISYTVPPYWEPFGDRKHFLWKSCTTAANCESEKQIAGKHCMREWYMDWRCVECCQGELCNYYATLKSSRLVMNPWVLAFAVGITVTSFLLPTLNLTQ